MWAGVELPRMIASAAPEVKASSEIELPYPSKVELVKFLKELKTFGEFYSTIDEYSDYYPSGFDATDPPLRGYLDEDAVSDFVNNSYYMMEIFEDNNSNFVRQLEERCAMLGAAMIVYLEHILK